MEPFGPDGPQNAAEWELLAAGWREIAQQKIAEVERLQILMTTAASLDQESGQHVLRAELGTDDEWPYRKVVSPTSR